MDKKQLEADFHHAMLEIYDLAKKLPTPYRATRFKQMVDEMGGKAAADNYWLHQILAKVCVIYTCTAKKKD